jgi:hypothetical protein
MKTFFGDCLVKMREMEGWTWKAGKAKPGGYNCPLPKPVPLYFYERRRILDDVTTMVHEGDMPFTPF